MLTGYSFFLEYYCVSWVKAFPEYLEQLQLQLPFGKEYEFSMERVVA